MSAFPPTHLAATARARRPGLLARWVLLLAVAAGLLAPSALAQTIPAAGDWFSEQAEIGFRVRAPKDWRFVPANLGDPVLLAKYVPTGRDWVPLKGDAQLWIWGWVLRFDPEAYAKHRAEMLRKMYNLSGNEEIPEELWEAIGGLEVDREQVITSWLNESQNQGNGWKLVEENEIRAGKRTIEERVYEGTMSWGPEAFPVRVYLAILPVDEKRWVAVAFNGPGEKAAWKKHENAYRRLGRTLELLELENAQGERPSGPESLRDKRRRELVAEVERMPGWWLYETPNYFVLTDSSSKKFIEELGDRLEAIRAVYEVDYPYTKARQYETPGAKPQPADGADPEGEGEGESPPTHQGGGTVAARNSYELSRTSVVRVCSDPEMYHEYGGPYGSAGYWSPIHEELVIYDDRKGAGRADTWSTMNHEAFHQYIFYFYGNISPHRWYDEGTGDFYAGYQYDPRRKRFTLTPFDWRKSLARDLVRSKRFVPLKEFVRFSHSEYYGNNSYGLAGGECYALGWSFIWFLRTGKGKGFDPAWGVILDTYLEELARTADVDKAVDKAFEGIDWAKLEAAWIDSTKG